ncbi:MAG: hypothetical protein H7317_01725 [Pseudorhodobacter sp.]|nr:hypothetical protein [Pseudorhodobacter sp.]
MLVGSILARKATIMSAPQTNIEKQKRWHRGPLIGMALVAIFGVGMIFFWMMHEASNDSESGAPPGAVGAPVQTEDTGKPAAASP